MEGIEKTKIIDKIEFKFGKDIESILKESTKRYKNIHDQSSALNISVPYLYMLIRKYFGDYISFMLTYTRGLRKKRYIKHVTIQKFSEDFKDFKKELKNIHASNF